MGGSLRRQLRACADGVPLDSRRPPGTARFLTPWVALLLSLVRWVPAAHGPPDTFF